MAPHSAGEKGTDCGMGNLLGPNFFFTPGQGVISLEFELKVLIWH